MTKMTVAELMEHLRKYPADMPVVINDADTSGGVSDHGYLLNLRTIEVVEGALALGGDYGDEHGQRS
jgi:hypothetical protein